MFWDYYPSPGAKKNNGPERWTLIIVTNFYHNIFCPKIYKNFKEPLKLGTSVKIYSKRKNQTIAIPLRLLPPKFNILIIIFSRLDSPPPHSSEILTVHSVLS